MAEGLTLEGVRGARERIRPFLAPTPLRPSLAVPDVDLRLKLECWQPTGSFKVRGALSFMTALDEGARDRGVVAASAGNHALGVAFAAECLGGTLNATLFVPTTAPRAKLEKLERFPVDVRLAGATYDDSVEAAAAFRRETGATEVPAFEDPGIAAGQGTVGLEIVEECPGAGTIVVPVGGGGLIAGLAVAAKAILPGIRIVAVQPEASPALRESLEAGRPLFTYPARPTLADGVSGGIGQIVFDHRDLIDDVVTVTEDEIEDAIVALLSADQVVAEASGALGVAAVRAGRLRPGDGRPVVAVITGANIDTRVLTRLLAARS
ncbi:MAG: pyridoxal-phosphate dependent enzyme [Acidobacteria bacterium]|nr:pyridoxal-phosphate dependent enzyme [Acidobacteriota bacterium]